MSVRHHMYGFKLVSAFDVLCGVILGLMLQLALVFPI